MLTHHRGAVIVNRRCRCHLEGLSLINTQYYDQQVWPKCPTVLIHIMEVLIPNCTMGDGGSTIMEQVLKRGQDFFECFPNSYVVEYYQICDEDDNDNPLMGVVILRLVQFRNA